MSRRSLSFTPLAAEVVSVVFIEPLDSAIAIFERGDTPDGASINRDLALLPRGPRGSGGRRVSGEPPGRPGPHGTRIADKIARGPHAGSLGSPGTFCRAGEQALSLRGFHQGAEPGPPGAISLA